MFFTVDMLMKNEKKKHNSFPLLLVECYFWNLFAIVDLDGRRLSLFADHLETWSTVKRQPNEAYIRHIFGETSPGIDEPPFQAEHQPRCYEEQGCCSECSQITPRWRCEPIRQVVLQPCERIRTDKMANSKIWRNLAMPRVAPRSICEPRRSNYRRTGIYRI